MDFILAVFGSRTFVDYERLEREILARWRNIAKIHTGGKNKDEAVDGACKQAVKFAKKYGIPYEIFPPTWRRNVKGSFYPVRDARFLGESTEGIAFWNNKSKGTQGEIQTMKRLKKRCEVIPFLEKHWTHKWIVFALQRECRLYLYHKNSCITPLQMHVSRWKKSEIKNQKLTNSSLNLFLYFRVGWEIPL